MDEIIEIIRKEKKLLFFCQGLVHVLYTYLLLNAADISYDKAVILILSFDENDKKYNSRICERLKEQGISCFVLDKMTKIQRLIGYSNLRNSRIKKKVYELTGFRAGEYCLVNFSWNQMFVCYPACLYFDEADSAIFIEEGITQYAMPRQKPLMMFIRKLYGEHPHFWEDSRLKGIFVQRVKNYNKELQPYLSGFEFEKMISNLDNVQDCYKLFVDKEEYYIFQKYKGSDVGIIFTQPLSEDGYISETEKKEMYRQLVERYSREGEPILKVHPRDLSDYSDVCTIVDYNRYPSELLRVLGIRVKYSIGISTSAVYSVQADSYCNINENFLNDKLFSLK